MNAEEQLARPTTLPQPPQHLAPATRRWFSEIVKNYVLESHHLRLLVLACEALDRGEAARKQIAKHGMTVPGRYGPRSNPEIAIERDSRLAFARLLREIDLDAEAPSERRPPPLRRYV